MTESFRSEVLGQLSEMSSNISRPHNFDFYLYLPTELSAKQADEKVRARSFIAEVSPAASGSDWLCKATIRIVHQTEILTAGDRTWWEFDADIKNGPLLFIY